MAAGVIAESVTPLRLLMIEDSPSDAMLLAAALRDSVLSTATIERDATLEAALRRLGTSTFDAILLDLGLPDCAGLDNFLRVSEAAAGAAVVVVTARDDDRLGEEAVRLGGLSLRLQSDRHEDLFGVYGVLPGSGLTTTVRLTGSVGRRVTLQVAAPHGPWVGVSTRHTSRDGTVTMALANARFVPRARLRAVAEATRRQPRLVTGARTVAESFSYALSGAKDGSWTLLKPDGQWGQPGYR